MNILVVGWYGHNNCGDESYLLSIPKLFPSIKFDFVNAIDKSKLFLYDAVILGGGNVFKSSFLSDLKNIKDKPIYGFSIGAEQAIETDIKFSHIYAREYFSVDVFKKIGIPCSFLPDAAFILDGDKNKGKKYISKYFNDAKNDLYSKVVVIIINSYLVKGGLSDLAKDSATFLKFSYDMARIIDETSASFLFLPFGTSIPSDDRVPNSWIASKCKYCNKNCVIFDKLDVQTTLDIISAADLVVSSRLHSSIFSFSEGVPFIDITHHSKNRNFLTLVDKNDISVSFWNFDIDLLKDKISEGLNKTRNQAESIKIKSFLRESANAIRFDR